MKVKITHVSSLLIMATAAAEMATDIYTPSLSFLTRIFHTSDETIALTLSLYLLGFSISSLIYGPLSDSLGRRIVLLTGLGIFMLSSFGCGLAQNVNWLITLRVMQGFGAGVVGVLGGAIIKDIYEGNECARVFSSMDIASALSPVIAPILGGYIMTYLGWQWCFFFIFIFSLFLFFTVNLTFGETLPLRRRQKFSLKNILLNYLKILKCKKFVSYNFATAFLYGGFWSYLSITAFYFTNALGYSGKEYGYFQALLVGFYIIGSLSNKFLLTRFSLSRMLFCGLLISILGGVILVFVSKFYATSPYVISTAMAISSISMGIIFPNAATFALGLFPKQTGAASAMLSFIDMLVASLAIWISGIVYKGSFFEISLIILTCFLIANFSLRHIFYENMFKVKLFKFSAK